MTNTQLATINSEKLEQGYKACRRRVKKELKPWAWLLSNVGGDNRRGIETLLAHFLETVELLDLDNSDDRSLNVWKEVQEELDKAFDGEAASPELLALVDTCRRFGVDSRLVYEPVRIVERWIVNREFQTFEQLASFCNSFGGSMMAALAPVIGVVNQDYEHAAMACGKAVMLTQLLANCVNDMKHNRIFLAKEDWVDCDVDTSRLKLRKPTQEFRYLVRLYTSRLDEVFLEAGHLIGCLDFDGRRSVGSLLAACWKTASKMKVEPDSILAAEGVLSTAERFKLRSKHLLGIELKLPFVTDHHGHH